MTFSKFRLLFAAFVVMAGGMYATPGQAQAGDAADGGGVVGGAGDGEEYLSEDGYIWHNNGGIGNTYTSGSLYAYNPSGGDIEVERTATGKYIVEFLGTTFLLPIVTAYETNGDHCKIERYFTSFDEVFVGCYDPSGAAVDARFTLRLTTTTEDATALVNGLSGTVVNNENNPWGAPQTSVRNSTGNYTVTTPGGPGFDGGNIQVTAYGLNQSNHCKVNNWSDTTANILCFNSSGNPVDPTGFTFLRIGSEDDLFVWANNATSTTAYTTNTIYSHNPQGNDPTSEKTSTGFYRLEFPGLMVDGGGLLNVTAYGSSSDSCSVRGWGSIALVVCTDSSGNPVDTRFSMLYTRFQTCQGVPANIEIGNNVPTNGNDVIAGTSGDDSIFALGGNDLVCGNGGDDFIVGANGNDSIYGGNGDDTISGNSGNDYIETGPGNDTSFAGSGNDVVYGGTGDDLLGGSSGFDRVYGEADDDRINGGSDADGEVFGGDGNDAVNGGGGDDNQVNGGPGNDTVSGNGGNDVITGAAGQDEVRGGPGDDFVFGGPDNDFMAGNDGNDTCDGEGGVDTAASNCETTVNIP